MRLRRGLLVVPSILIFFTAIAFVFFDIMKVDEKSLSMMPTLYPGDYLIIVRYTEAIKRDDIVLFLSPIEEKEVIKRVVGLPGEKLELRFRNVYINNNVLIEPYISSVNKIIPSDENRGAILPFEHFFLLGDNRYASIDSRDFGPVHRNRIHEKVIGIMWPIEHVRWLW